MGAEDAEEIETETEANNVEKNTGEGADDKVEDEVEDAHPNAQNTKFLPMLQWLYTLVTKFLVGSVLLLVLELTLPPSSKQALRSMML